MDHLGLFFATAFSAFQMFLFSFIYSCFFTSSSTCTASEIIIYTHDLLSLQSYWISMLFYSCSATLNQSLSHLTSHSGGQPGIFTSRLTPSRIFWPVRLHSFITANPYAAASAQENFDSKNYFTKFSFAVIFLRHSLTTGCFIFMSLKETNKGIVFCGCLLCL